MAKLKWARLEVDYWRNPKIRRVGVAAAVAHQIAFCWSAQYATDGRIPIDVLHGEAAAFAKPADFKRLIDARMLVIDGDEYVIHDYLDYQPTAEQAARDAAKNRAKQARWRERQSLANAKAAGVDTDAIAASHNPVSNPVSNQERNPVSNPPYDTSRHVSSLRSDDEGVKPPQTPPVKRSRKKPDLPPATLEETTIFDGWKRALALNGNTSLTADKLKAIRAAIDSGYTHEQLAAAAIGIRTSEHHMASGYNDLSYAVRTGNILRFAELADAPPWMPDDFTRQAAAQHHRNGTEPTKPHEKAAYRRWLAWREEQKP